MRRYEKAILIGCSLASIGWMLACWSDPVADGFSLSYGPGPYRTQTMADHVSLVAYALARIALLYGILASRTVTEKKS